MAYLLTPTSTKFDNGTILSIPDSDGKKIDYVYDDKIPTTADPVVLEEGINGLAFTYDGTGWIRD